MCGCNFFQAYVSPSWGLINLCLIQNKKRKFDRDRDERDSKDRREEEATDPLKDATTLYVGNLYAVALMFALSVKHFLKFITARSLPRKNKYMNFLQSESCLAIGPQFSLTSFCRKMWRDQATSDGPRSISKNSLRLLLRRILHSSRCT